MNELVIAVALAVPALAAPSVSPPPGLPPAQPPYWLNLYSLAPSQEFWTGRMRVKNLEQALPKILQAAQKEGAAPSQELKTFVSSRTAQQLVLLVPRARADALLKKLRKLGDLPAPDARAEGAPPPLAEVRAKIDRIMKERVDRRAELAKTPTSAAIEEELLERLLLVEEVAKRRDDSIRFNLTVEQR